MGTVNTFMFRKVSSIKELRELTKESIKTGDLEKPCEIIDTIKLNQNEYADFSKNLLKDTLFLSKYKHTTYYDNNVWKCVLVMLGNNDTNNIVVACEGFNYARYVGVYTNEFVFLFILLKSREDK